MNMKNATDFDWRTKDEQFVWHAMSPYNPQNTMIIEKSEGVWVTDIDGNRYLDAMAGLWCVNVGYGREEIAKANFTISLCKTAIHRFPIVILQPFY